MLILGFKACPAAIQGQRQLVRDGRRLIRLRYPPATSPAKKEPRTMTNSPAKGVVLEETSGRTVPRTVVHSSQKLHGGRGQNGPQIYIAGLVAPNGAVFIWHAKEENFRSLRVCLLLRNDHFPRTSSPPSSLRSEWAQPVRGRTGLASRATFREVGPFALYLFPGYFRRCCDALAKLAPGLPSFRARYELRR